MGIVPSDGRRDTADLCPRVCGRPSLVGAASAVFRAPLSSHHVCRPRLSAFRCARRQTRAFGDIAAEGIIWRSTRHTSSDFRWAGSRRCISGSAIRAARSLVVAGCGYGAEKRRTRQFEAEVQAVAKFIEEKSRRSPTSTPLAQLGCSSRTRTPAVSPNSANGLPSTPNSAPAIHNWACKLNGLRCTISSTTCRS